MSLFDLHRILLGKGTWWLLLEVSIRSAFLFVLIMSSMRLLGRRVASQYTLFELSVVVTLAGAVGVPLQATDRGLLPPLLIMLVVITLQRGLAWASLRSARVDHAVSGQVSAVICRSSSMNCARRIVPGAALFASARQRGSTPGSVEPSLPGAVWEHLAGLGADASPRSLDSAGHRSVSAKGYGGCTLALLCELWVPPPQRR